MEKIAFYKKLWWSIARPSKYNEMMKTGLKKAIKYFFGIVAILALILSIAGTCIQVKDLQDLGKYLDENIPEFKFENTAKEGEEAKYRFNLENNEAIILDGQDFIKSFKSVVVANTNIKEKDAIKEYYSLSTENNYCLVLLKDKCIMISSKYNPDNENKDEGIIKLNYDEVLKQYIGTQENEFDKQDLLSVFNNISYPYYIIMYFVNYFIVLFVLFTLDVIVIGIATIISFKILKKEITKKQTFSLSIYSCTLPMILYIVYLIFNYFLSFNFAYINFITILIAAIYVILYYYKNKNENIA